MCKKAVDTYPSAMQFVCDWYKTYKMCDKAVDTCLLVFESVPDLYETQRICDKVVSKEPFMLKYCLDRHKTQEMSDKAANVFFLPTLKLFLICLLQIKCFKNLMMLWSLMIFS